MNLKNTLMALLLLAASIGVGVAQDKFKISGKLDNAGSDKKVILNYVDSEGKRAKDSTVLKNGRFSLTGTTAYGNKAYLTLEPLQTDTSVRRGDFQVFYLEKGAYQIRGKDSMATASITGTQAQADHLAYQRMIKTPQEEYQALTPIYLEAQRAKDSMEMERIKELARPPFARLEAAIDSFIFSHPDSYVGLDVIMQNKATVIDPETFPRYYDVLSERVLASFTGRQLTEKYEKSKQIAVGKTVADFILPDDQGNDFSLLSLRGQYVLVDFWASWCAPCRAENVHLLKAYNELQDKNFKIVGVSLDENKASWLHAVKQDGMPWIQVSDLKGFNTDIAKKYDISAIPQNFLINPEGVIIAKNLRGEDVNEQIAALMR